MKTSLRLLLTLAALTAILSRVADAATPGDLYVAETGTASILKFDSAGNKSIIGQFQYPVGLAFDSAGNLFEGESGTSAIVKIGPDGGQTTFATDLNNPAGLAFDGAGNLYESDLGSGTIFKIAIDGTKTAFVTTVASPTGLAFDRAGNLYAGDQITGTIYRITPGGETSAFVSGMTFPAGIAFDSAGNLFVADITDNTILKFAPDGSRSTFASGLDGPAGLAFDDAGNLYETENRGGAILKFTPDGTQTTFASGLSFPTLLAFAPVPQKVLNVSARGFVLREDNALIAGFILGGNTLNNNKVIVRAIGPSLTGLGVTNALQDPTVEVRDARGALVAANDNWQETQETDLAASNLAPGHANESAVLIALPAGSYTAILRGAGGTIGIGLIEIYSAL